MENKEHILELRKRIPIGFIAAERLLSKCEFDISKAVDIWKNDNIERLSNTFSLKKSEAKELLEFTDYNYSKALSIYKERKTTEVEKILEFSKNEEQVLGNFWVLGVIEG